MKRLESLTTADLMIKLVRTEHCLLKSFHYKPNLTPYLSQRRRILKAEYDRRLYGR